MGRIAVGWLVGLLLIAGLAVPPGLAAAPGTLDEGIQDLAQQIAPQIQRLGKKRLAVVDFADLNGRVTDLGRFIAEELSADLATAGGGLRVVDRQHLSKIIAEQKLSVTGVTEPRTVQRLGQLADAEVILAGSIVLLDDKVRITAKALSTTTADIVAAAQTTVPYDATVQSLYLVGSQPGDAAAPPAAPRLPAAGPAGGRAGVPLGDLRFTAAQPDGYHFSLVTKPFTVGGRTLRGGLLVFPTNGRSQVTYELSGRFDTFSTVIGLPDPVPPSVRVTFRIYADGALVYPGRTLRPGDAAVPVRVRVSGAQSLTLVVEGNGIPTSGSDVTYALWGEPTLVEP